MPLAWAESPPKMVAEKQGGGPTTAATVTADRPARTSSYVPPHLRNRTHDAAPAIPVADVVLGGAAVLPNSGGGPGVLGASGPLGSRQGGAWAAPQAAGAAPAAWGDDRQTSNGSGWAPTVIAGPGAGWENGGGRSWGHGGSGRGGGWGGGRDREVNPFANEEVTVEVAVFDRENTGINFDAYEDIPVETSGENVPQSVNTFAEIDLGHALNENIRRCKYVKPTPVQKHAIPISLAGRDLMACAQTGSGKTAAFCFPIIAGIMRNTPPGRPRGGRKALPLALILSPTRELSCQVCC